VSTNQIVSGCNVTNAESGECYLPPLTAEYCLRNGTLIYISHSCICLIKL